MDRRASKLASRLLAATALAALMSGCTLNLIRNPKEPEIFKERIAYYKWLVERGLLENDPALARDAMRELLGLKGERERLENRDDQDRLATDEILRRLLEGLEQLLREKRTPTTKPQN